MLVVSWTGFLGPQARSLAEASSASGVALDVTRTSVSHWVGDHTGQVHRPASIVAWIPTAEKIRLRGATKGSFGAKREEVWRPDAHDPDRLSRRPAWSADSRPVRNHEPSGSVCFGRLRTASEAAAASTAAHLPGRQLSNLGPRSRRSPSPIRERARSARDVGGWGGADRPRSQAPAFRRSGHRTGLAGGPPRS